MDSLRSLTGRIRHLDHDRARQLVELFARPVLGDRAALGYDSDDPITSSSHGWLRVEGGPHPAGTAVGSFATHLYLHELVRLPLSVARVLAGHRGHLYLDKLVRFTDAVAAELGRHVGGGLSLNNLRRLTVVQAEALGRHEHELSLNQIRELTPALARGLARHANELHLEGLERLSAPAAAALARHRGDLLLGGPRSLTAAVADHLATHRGKLHLHGVETLTTATAGAFGRRRGYLCLNKLRRLTPAQAELLAGHSGALMLNSVTLDQRTADCLGAHEGSLVIRLANDCGLFTLAAILGHRGAIHIDGLVDLDIPRARLLARQRRSGGQTGLDGLFLPDVRRISPPVAAVLATHRGGGLWLRGLESLDEETACELVRHPLLALDGMRKLSDRVANILATHTGGTLSLAGLETVSGRGLTALRANDDVILPPRLARPERAAGLGPPRARRSWAEIEFTIDAIALAGEEALG